MAKAKSTKKAKPSQKTKRFKWTRQYFDQYNYLGTVLGFILLFFSFYPSLLPRSWIFQALLAAVLFCIGYAVGTALSHFIRKFDIKEPQPERKQQIKKYTAFAMVALYILALILGYNWQKEVRELVNVQTEFEGAFLATTILILLLISIIMAFSRLLRKISRWLGQQIDKLLPKTLSYVLGWTITALVVFGLIEGFVIDNVSEGINQAFSVRNGTTDPGITQPVSSNMSGSSESLIPWESLGKQGRKFIGTTIPVNELTDFSGEQAIEPVRIYSGLESADDARSRAELAVQDLKRAGGFEKDVLVVVTTTGTGWVDENGVDPIEYMYNGDSAIVAMQYSYLPSWISFIVDQDKAKEAGVELYNAVFHEWIQLPVEERPQIVSFGESLGSFGGEAAFPTEASFRATSQGALFVGPPNSNAIWENLVSNRDEGSTEVLPIVREGNSARFAARSDDFEKPKIPINDWTDPKLVYLQNGSDPIVWWSPSLLYNEPDWLKEDPAFDVSPAVTWLPFVTFFQVSADMAVGTHTPDGFGHKYGDLTVDAWEFIAPPDEWNNEKSKKLKDLISTRTLK